MSRLQRAMWTVLFFTLVGPFLGALIAAIGSPVLMWANMGPFAAADHPPFDWANVPAADSLLPLLGRVAIATYVWCSIPAVLTGLSLVPHIFRKGSVGWLEAVVGAALFLAATSVVLGLQHGGILVYLCFAAAVVALVCWLILRAIGVLPPVPARDVP